MKKVANLMNVLGLLTVFSTMTVPVFALNTLNICAPLNLQDENYKSVCDPVCKKEEMKTQTFEAGSTYMESCKQEDPQNTTGSVCVCKND